MDEKCKVLIEKIKSYNSSCDIELVEKAYDIAQKAHENQFRFSGEPYFEHPLEVANILAELEMDCKSIIAGLLHDVIEDTQYGVDEIKEEFGEDVALLVEGVTKLAKIPFSSKEQQQVDNLRKMFLAMAKDVRVIIIKLADRLHNMRTLKSMREDKQREKARETLEVFAPLAHRLGISKIKGELEDLSLKFLDPVAYFEISENISQKKTERETFIQDIIENLENKIETLDIKATVSGRAKHFYSIFRKMYAQNKSIDEIYDLFAVRVIVDNITECYAVLGLVHEMFKPIPGRFKDYIAMPKPNMYQSLHTTLIGPKGTPFEVQIRTWEMHKTAEYGIAAHWKYKEGSNTKDEFDGKLEWIRNMLDVQNDLSENDTEEFMKTLKIDLFTDEVFVFTPQGDVINLPVGSCPIDFAYAIHSAIGNKMVGAKINGKIATIDQKLETGDIVEILTVPTAKGPSLDWIKIVKTTQARSKINQWYKTHNRDEHLAKGKDLVDREIRKANIENINAFKDEFCAAAMEKFAIKTQDDVYVSIGFEGVISGKIVNFLLDRIKKTTLKKDNEVVKVKQPDLRTTSSSNGVIVKGIDNCLVRLAKCCNPILGDDIVGYITRGRGVSVHRKDCPNAVHIEATEQSRLIDVSWDNTITCSFNADLMITAINRDGLLLEVTAELSNQKISLVGVNARVIENISILDITVSVRDGEQLNSLVNKLKNISGITDIKRTNK